MTKVKVISKFFGTYKKGDIIEMADSTAIACASQKNPHVELIKVNKEKTK